ncbi:MAG: phosphoadenosine phosphosulfate reductase [Pseudomonadota bacterium]
MIERRATITTSLAGLTRADWLAKVDEITEDEGYVEPVGRNHTAVFIDREPTVLVVTFEEFDTVRLSNEDGHPLGFRLAQTQGWSHLCLMAHGETWFRDPAITGYMDRLTDEGFFEDFEHVIFYGAEMGAYGAAAYSVAAPGSDVVLVQPIASLEAARTPWDPRFRDKRRLDFTSRYGYAPEMLEAARRAFIIYDPREHLDSMHAALFDREGTVHLRCPFLGDRIEQDFLQMKILHQVLELAGEKRLDRSSFFRMYRRRRDSAAYLRRLLSALEEADRPWLAALLCRNAVERLNRQRFRDGLRNAQSQLLEKGITFTWPRLVKINGAGR